MKAVRFSEFLKGETRERPKSRKRFRTSLQKHIESSISLNQRLRDRIRRVIIPEGKGKEREGKYWEDHERKKK